MTLFFVGNGVGLAVGLCATTEPKMTATTKTNTAKTCIAEIRFTMSRDSLWARGGAAKRQRNIALACVATGYLAI